MNTLSPEPGLCATCRNHRVIRSDRGSTFYLCQLSRTDPAFPRYPRLPVLSCRGYEYGEPAEPKDVHTEPGG